MPRSEKNPIFKDSSDVDGADADWIVDQTLWDMKTTKYPDRSLPSDIKQILGYAFPDYTDRYHIAQEVSYYPRFRPTLQWPVGELLYNLSTEKYSMKNGEKSFASLSRMYRN
jgi:hypothetical protein